MKKQTTFISIAIILGVFIVDILTPLGFAVWLLYFIPLFLWSFEKRPHYLVLVSVVVTFLIITGYFFPLRQPVSVFPIANRSLQVLTLWIISFLILKRRQAEMALLRAHQDLEFKVGERTAELSQANKSLLSEVNIRKRMEEEIRYQAFHDLLTGLPNKALYMDRLSHELALSHRVGARVGVMFLDLDNFKKINDSFGHTTGDLLLKEVAVRLSSCIRETDTVSRIGGDEFTVLLGRISHPEDASKIADKILISFGEPFKISDHDFYMTTSIGISIFPDDGEDSEVLLKNADIAMYHAKEQGRSGYAFYSPALDIRTVERISLENRLRRTLERGELLVYYQPQIDLVSGNMACAEALVRWQHPELGLLGPVDFLPLAEETGIIVLIDEWVLRTACARNKAWQDAGFPPICISVNFSAGQFRKPDLVETVSSVLRDTGLDPGWLEIEISETIAMREMEHLIPSFEKLHALGIHLSIDDFGTGYTSLSYLKKLPVEKLKIDGSFVRGLADDQDYRAIVSAIVAMAHNLKLKAVAEGVETGEQLDFLQAAGCDEFQGYLFRKPLSKDDFEELFAAGRA